MSRSPRRQRLEVDVPDPRHVAAVRNAVVESEHGDGWPNSWSSVLSVSFAPAGLATSNTMRVFPPTATRSKRPNAGAATQPFGDLRRRYCESPRDRRRREGVVDVVDAGDLQANARGAFRHTEVERDPVDAVRFDGAGGDVERRTRVATTTGSSRRDGRRTRPDTRTGRRTARSTSSRPHAGALRRAARIVDTERRRACVRPGEIRHQRIVRVDDEKRLFGKAATIARQRSAISSSSP